MGWPLLHTAAGCVDVLYPGGFKGTISILALPVGCTEGFINWGSPCLPCSLSAAPRAAAPLNGARRLAAWRGITPKWLHVQGRLEALWISPAAGAGPGPSPSHAVPWCFLPGSPAPPLPAASSRACCSPSQGPVTTQNIPAPLFSRASAGSGASSRTSLPGTLGRGRLLGGDGHCWPWRAGAGGGAEPCGVPSLSPLPPGHCSSSMYSLTSPPPWPHPSLPGPKRAACENTARGQGPVPPRLPGSGGAPHPAQPPPLPPPTTPPRSEPSPSRGR